LRQSHLTSAFQALLVLTGLTGALVTLVGAYGLLRLGSFYERVHPPTMGTTLGTTLVLGASIVLFCALESRLVLHEILIAIFMVLSTPVTFLLLVRAAMHRDGIDNAGDAPGPQQARPSERDPAADSTRQ
jgi:multicomponent K+:H+ antiporter subunit G